MRLLRSVIWPVLLLMVLVHTTSAQIRVGTHSAGPVTFDTLPPVSEWSSRSVPPSNVNAARDPATLAAVVQTNSAAMISSALVASSVVPPMAATLASWSSAGHYVLTRPTGNVCTLLMATLTNLSGTTLSTLQISFDFVALTVPLEEMGYGIYYSISGATNSWIPLPGISVSDSAGNKQAELNLTNWPAGASLYILWADDNGSPSPDAALAIDNFRAIVPTLTFITEPVDQAVAPGATALFTTEVKGVPPFGFQWFKDSTELAGATNAVLTIANTVEGDAGEYHVVVTDARNSVTSRVAVLTVACLPLGITAQPTDQVLDPGMGLSLGLAVTGTPPVNVTWYKDGNPISGSIGTNASYLVASADPSDTGVYFGIVSNCAGSVTSVVVSVTVNCLSPAMLTNVPSAQSIFAGATLSLSAAASGSPRIRYQWYRNDMPIAGATNASFVKTNVNVTDTGLYRVAVANCGGTASSTNVLVFITERPYVAVGLISHWWSYNAEGQDLGTAWQEPDYDDSAWPVGRGILAAEDNGSIVPLINTVLPLTNLLGERLITYYFRTKFVVTNALDSIFLSTSNLFDDGMVVYVNGTEAYRMNMGSGVITYRTFPPGTTAEGFYWITNVSSDLFVQGTNTLAVEVHQVNRTSSDVAMGLHANIVESTPTALAITEQPSDATVPEAQAIRLTVGVTGMRASFQWFKDGVPIPGATRRTLTITNAAASDSGLYGVLVSNVVTRVLSRLASVSVIRDTVPPRLIAADYVDATHVLLSFSEAIVADSVTPDRFRALLYAGTEIPVTAAVLVNSTNVLIETGYMSGASHYLVSVTGVTDISPDRLVIAPGSRAPVARRFAMIASDASWFFYDPYPPIGDSPEAPDGWETMGFQEPLIWGYGPGGFISGNFSDLPVPFNSTLSAGPALTSYFRREFDLNVSRAGLRLFADIFYNDGVVLFLNGLEVARYNVPQGGTYADRAISAASGVLSNRLELPGSALLPGRNVLAVELHQAAPDDLNKAFALRLDARVESPLGVPLEIFSGPGDTTVEEGQPAMFRISAAGAEFFQWRLNGADVPGATNSGFLLEGSVDLDGALVSVRIATATNSLVSGNAVLHVTPDLTAPRLLAAYATNNTIMVQFSEPVSTASATNVANYVVRDGGGQVIAVTGAVIDDRSNVLLQTERPIVLGGTVTVENIRDTSANGNIVAPGSAAYIGTVMLVIPMDATWRYEQTGIDLGTSWKLQTFDDSAWFSGQALFYGRRGTDGQLPEPIRTRISLSNEFNTVQIPSYYFRATVTLPYAGSARVWSRFIVDDGVVIYVNGAEVARAGMPAGGITRNSLANRTVGDIPTLESAITEFPISLVAGTNVIAAEVHQASLFSADVTFAAELTLITDSMPFPQSVGASVVMKRWGDNLAFEWPGTNVLQAAEAITGPWQTISTAPPFFASPTGAMMFYRLGP